MSRQHVYPQRSTIVKLQRPLSDPALPWLAYDQTRRFLRGLERNELPDAVIEAMGDDDKAYFHADVKGLQLVRWKERAEEQPW